MRDALAQIVRDSLARAVEAGALPALPDDLAVVIEKPRQAEHGDFATNVAMGLARVARKAPRAIAEALVAHLDDPAALIASAEVAGPGFLNFRLSDVAIAGIVGEVLTAGPAYGVAAEATGPRVMVEFVSANPTGPLHVGHGRGAVMGDAIASLLQAAGYQVDREYYINDVGNQMQMLGRSLHARVQTLLGADTPLPEGGYQGDYLIETAEAFVAAHGEGARGDDFEAVGDRYVDFAKDTILDGIRADLEGLQITYDTWFSERSLHTSGKVMGAVEALQARDIIYEEDGALRFRTTDFGDDNDRVVVRADGRPTYFAADIAYHRDKFERGYDRAINIWGADHHGYVPRVRAALQASGLDPDALEIVLVQFVGLVRDGVQVKMSTRSGEFDELQALVDEVGADAVRFFFLMRRADSQLEFDLEVARRRSMDNPVFYVQYGHARLCSILRRADDEGVPPRDRADIDALGALRLPEERELLLQMAEYPHVVRRAAEAREPHQVVFYLMDTIKAFHGYYTRYKHTERVLSDDARKTAGRLLLVDALRTVIASGLALLKVDAPERMEAPADADDSDD